MNRMRGPVMGLGIAALLALFVAGVLIDWSGFRSKPAPQPDLSPSHFELPSQPDAAAAGDPRERRESRARPSEHDSNARSGPEPQVSATQANADAAHADDAARAQLLARANTGDVSAQAELCRQDIRSPDSQVAARAHFWCSTAAQAGDPASERYYADLLREGQGVPKDEQAAREWYEKAVKHGDIGALYVLGNILLDSTTPGDETRGLSLIQDAARKGDSRAIAVLQRRGMTTEPRYAQPADVPSR
jgi:TPR repeat protein